MNRFIPHVFAVLLCLILVPTPAWAQPAAADHGAGTQAECQQYGCLYGHHTNHYDRDGNEEIAYGIAHDRLPDGPDGRFYIQVLFPMVAGDYRYDPTRRAMWDETARCESTWRWDIDSTFDGGIQFSPTTWRAYGGEEFASYAYLATPEQQIAVGERVLWRGYGPHSPQGAGAWPHCGRHMTAP